MKTAFVYFTLNAESSCDWEAALAAVAHQSFEVDLKLVVDSESTDRTVELAESRGWEVHTVKRRNFNHGLTRDEILRHLDRRGFDIAVYASQDAVPEGNNSVKNLVDYLVGNQLIGVYGRQSCTGDTHPLNQWQKMRCYPDESFVKGKENIPDMGLMTAFCSNTFAAWKIRDFLRYGGFPATNFGEDMLASARIILAGGKIGYCAEATCKHVHPATWRFLFVRGYEIGYMHGRTPWLLKVFGTAERSQKNLSISGSIVIPLAVKYAGYLLGKLIGRLMGRNHAYRENGNEQRPSLSGCSAVTEVRPEQELTEKSRE